MGNESSQPEKDGSSDDSDAGIKLPTSSDAEGDRGMSSADTPASLAAKSKKRKRKSEGEKSEKKKKKKKKKKSDASAIKEELHSSPKVNGVTEPASPGFESENDDSPHMKSEAMDGLETQERPASAPKLSSPELPNGNILEKHHGHSAEQDVAPDLVASHQEKLSSPSPGPQGILAPAEEDAVMEDLTQENTPQKPTTRAARRQSYGSASSPLLSIPPKAKKSRKSKHAQHDEEPEASHIVSPRSDHNEPILGTQEQLEEDVRELEVQKEKKSKKVKPKSRKKSGDDNNGLAEQPNSLLTPEATAKQRKPRKSDKLVDEESSSQDSNHLFPVVQREGDDDRYDLKEGPGDLDVPAPEVEEQAENEDVAELNENHMVDSISHSLDGEARELSQDKVELSSPRDAIPDSYEARGNQQSQELPTRSGQWTSVNGFKSVNGEASHVDSQPQKSGKKKQTFLKAKTPLSAIQRDANNEPSTSSVKGKERAFQAQDNGDSEIGSRIGVYKESGTPIKKRKRRMPTDDVEEGESSLARSLKKMTSTAKTSNNSIASARARKTKSTPKPPKLKASEPSLIGKFTPDELNILENELLKFREMNDISERDQNELIAGSLRELKTKEMFDQLCEALPSRTRTQIVKICRRKFHNYTVRGRWTEDEDEELRNLYESYPKKWQQIAEIMHRHPEDVRDRWRNYAICGDNLKKDRWTDEEEQALRKALDDCLYSVAVMKQQHRQSNPGSSDYTNPDIEYVDWQVVSAQMGHTRNRLQCMAKWKLMEEREVANGNTFDLDFDHKSWRVDLAKKDYKMMTRDEKLELLLNIRDCKAGRERKVPWGQLPGESLRKYTPMARKVAWTKLRALTANNREMKLQEIVEQLIRRFSGTDQDVESESSLEDEPTPKAKTPKKSNKRSPESKLSNDTATPPGKASRSNKFVTESDDEALDAEDKRPNKKARKSTTKEKKLKTSGKTKLKDRMDVDRETPQLDVEGDVPMVNGFHSAQDEDEATPSRAPKPKGLKTKAPQRTSMVMETSPPREVEEAPEIEPYDSSIDDHDMDDIPARLREVSTEL